MGNSFSVTTKAPVLLLQWVFRLAPSCKPLDVRLLVRFIFHSVAVADVSRDPLPPALSPVEELNTNGHVTNEAKNVLIPMSHTNLYVTCNAITTQDSHEKVLVDEPRFFIMRRCAFHGNCGHYTCECRILARSSQRRIHFHRKYRDGFPLRGAARYIPPCVEPLSRFENETRPFSRYARRTNRPTEPALPAEQNGDVDVQASEPPPPPSPAPSQCSSTPLQPSPVTPTKDASPPSPSTVAIPIPCDCEPSPRRGFAFVFPARVGGNECAALVDTGANVNLFNANVFQTMFPNFVTSPTSTRAKNASGREMDVLGLVSLRCAIDYRFRHLPFSVGV